MTSIMNVISMDASQVTQGEMFFFMGLVCMPDLCAVAAAFTNRVPPSMFFPTHMHAILRRQRILSDNSTICDEVK